MIISLCGDMSSEQKLLFQQNPRFFGLKLNFNKTYNFDDFLRHKMTKYNRSTDAINIIKRILVVDENKRPSID